MQSGDNAPTKALAEATGIGRREARRKKAAGLDTPEKINNARAASGRIRVPVDIAKKIGLQRLRLLTAQADNEEIDREERRGQIVEVSRVLDALTKAEATKIARERAAFVVSLPAKLGGQPADKIAAAYEKELNEIHAEYVKQFKTLAGL